MSRKRKSPPTKSSTPPPLPLRCSSPPLPLRSCPPPPLPLSLLEALPDVLFSMIIGNLGARQVLSQQLLCVSSTLRNIASALFFNENHCRAIFPSLNPAHICRTLTDSLRAEIAPGPEGDVATLLQLIRGSDRGWECFCRKVFLSEQLEGKGSRGRTEFDLDFSDEYDEYEDEELARCAVNFAHRQTDEVLFLVEMRCTRREKRVVFAYGKYGALYTGWGRRPGFGWPGNSYDKASRVVLDESDGIVSPWRA